MSQPIPKGSLQPFRQMKGEVRQSRRIYTLKLLDERTRGSAMPAFPPSFLDVLTVSQPTPSLGWCLPNSFEVTIDDVVAIFTVALVKRRNRGQWVISSLAVSPRLKNTGIEELNLPLQTFLRDAINLSSFHCVTYPRGYVGESFVLKANGQKNSRLQIGKDEIFSEVIGWANSTPAPILRDFVGSDTGRKRISKSRLEIVAKAHMEAPHGEKHRRVKQALERSEGFIGDETVKNLIKQAIKQGLIRTEARRNR
jgi:hypothetical protein